MAKQQINSWTTNEDMIIAEAMLRQARSGINRETIINELTENLVGRTEKAIENRWYKHLKKNYENALNISKSKRIQEKVQMSFFDNTEEKEQETIIIQEPKRESKTNLNIDEIINFLERNKELFKNQSQNEEIERLQRENAVLKKQVRLLESENEELKEDHIAFATIINKAREFFGEEKLTSIQYKINKQGQVINTANTVK